MYSSKFVWFFLCWYLELICIFIFEMNSLFISLMLCCISEVYLSKDTFLELQWDFCYMVLLGWSEKAPLTGIYSSINVLSAVRCRRAIYYDLLCPSIDNLIQKLEQGYLCCIYCKCKHFIFKYSNHLESWRLNWARNFIVF